MTSQWIDKGHRAVNCASEQTELMLCLADSFGHTGNVYVAQNLRRMAYKINASLAIFDKVMDDVLDQRLDESRESMASVASFALSFGRYSGDRKVLEDTLQSTVVSLDSMADALSKQSTFDQVIAQQLRDITDAVRSRTEGLVGMDEVGELAVAVTTSEGDTS